MMTRNVMEWDWRADADLPTTPNNFLSSPKA